MSTILHPIPVRQPIIGGVPAVFAGSIGVHKTIILPRIVVLLPPHGWSVTRQERLRGTIRTVGVGVAAAAPRREDPEGAEKEKTRRDPRSHSRNTVRRLLRLGVTRRKKQRRRFIGSGLVIGVVLVRHDRSKGDN